MACVFFMPITKKCIRYYLNDIPLMMMFEHRKVGIKNLKKKVFDPPTVLRYPNLNVRISNYGVQNAYRLYIIAFNVQ